LCQTSLGGKTFGPRWADERTRGDFLGAEWFSRRRETGSLCASDGLCPLQCTAGDYIPSTKRQSEASLAYRSGAASGEQLLFPTKPKLKKKNNEGACVLKDAWPGTMSMPL